MKKIFLASLSKDQKDFLNLLELTGKMHGEEKPAPLPKGQVIWDENFFHLSKSRLWKSLDEKKKNEIILGLGEKILQEAYFIECAGMVYAAKMNLAAATKEEREFYCFVGEEEVSHLRMLESLGNFSAKLDKIPSFALLIGEIINEATKPGHLLLIQILLEGWGLHYYKSLQKAALPESVAAIFKAILKDELRHHSSGEILFAAQRDLSPEDEKIIFSFLDRLMTMVKVGPWSVCEEVFSHIRNSTLEDLRTFLVETEALKLTEDKIKYLEGLLKANLLESTFDKVKDLFIPLTLEEMLVVLGPLASPVKA